MSEVERVGAVIAGWFLHPAGARAEERVARRLVPIEEPVVLVGGDGAALGLGAVLALAIASDGVAVVACWRVAGAERRRSGVAVGKARRRVAALEARGVDATAAGRLVVVALPPDAAQAVALLQRVENACGTAVCVPVLGGARGTEWDAVLQQRGAAVLHGADPAVLELAARGLAEQGVRAQLLDRAPSLFARTMAVGGWRPPGARALRGAVAGAEGA
jgi:hypothetical protein